MKLLCETCRKEIKQDKRTDRQNAYFHVIIKIISDSLPVGGYTPAQVKILVKDQFNMYKEFTNKKTGEVMKDYKSTTELSKKEFAKLTEDLKLFCESHGIIIFSPEEFYERNCYK